MSYAFGDDVILLTKQLIQATSGCNEDSEIFKQLEKYVVSNLQRADTLFFMGQKELDRNINSLCDKFIFHGFPRQAKELKRYYDKLVPEGLAKQERLNRMNVIKFLLCISESPTNNFYKYPQRFDKGDEETIIDWPKYLKEGIPRWSPPLDDDSSDNDSDNLDERFLSLDDGGVTDCNSKFDLCISDTTLVKEKDPLLEYRISKTNLLANVQSQWFNMDHVCFKPISDDKDANVAILWDSYIRQTTKGLIHIEPTTIISEYKIMREVIWQFYEPHSSSCFKFKGNTLIPDLNVTIASVRTKACESFLHEFIPYIDWLQTLRDFHESLIRKHNDPTVVPPDTYRSYDFALQTVTDPLYVALKTIENKIRAQETTVTLLTLANEIRPLFQTVKVLKDIHNNAVLDFESNSPLQCATTLLWRLHKGLFYASAKLEQDLYLTLYLHSLYKYFTIIQSWLGRDVLEDCTGEFVIADENPKDAHVLFNHSLFSAPNQPVCDERTVQEGDQDWQMQFSVKDLGESARCDSVISIISTEVLQIGKNIHLLRLLGKLHLVPEFTGVYKESFYEAYTKKILENISQYFNIKEEIDEVLENEPELEPSSPTFVFPATCPDECKYLTEMDKLENLVDTTDCFLVQAFQSFFVKKPETKAAETKEILFEKIRKVTQGLFPVQQMVDDVFIQILRERFSISGKMVKNVLINDYNLEKQFVFLKSIFLFKDDLIFPLYRRIFQQMDSEGLWGNHTWLTSYLQDIIMDTYPNFYEECSVEVKENWKLCSDPLKACQMISIQYRIRWPVNIIIRKEHMAMYKDLFQFILKIKWALYTLNHLYFAELEPRGKMDKNQHKYTRKLIAKLKILRFGLLNIFSSIQHYILGHIFSKISSKFEKALEGAYDLESLLQAHANFVQTLHKSCIDFQEYNKTSYGLYLLLYLVRKLRIVWRNLREVTEEELDKLEKSYWMCHKTIDPIINPTSNRTFIYDD